MDYKSQQPLRLDARRPTAVGGAGLGGAENPTAAPSQAPTAASAQAARRTPALRPPPRALAAGHRDAQAQATGRSAGAGDEREEPA